VKIWPLVIAICVVVGGAAYALVKAFSPAPSQPVEHQANTMGVQAPAVQQTAPAPSAPAQHPAATGVHPPVKPATPDAVHQNSTPAPTAPRMHPAPGQTAPPVTRGADGHRPNPRFAVFGLVRFFRNVGRLAEDDSTTPLTPAQAKGILAVMTPLRTQKTLTPDDAEKVRAQLEKQLTPAQLEAIKQANANRFSQRGGGPQGGPPGGAGGPGGPGGGAVLA